MASNPSGRPGAPFPRHFRSKHTRTKTGCLTCRRRKKKCDEARPSCVTCVRSHFNCEYAAEKDSPTRNSGSVRRQFPLPLDRLTYSGSNGACALTPESARLLDHYLVVTAVQIPAVALAMSQNPFISCVLPQAHNDDLLMHAVLAVSGAHLSHKLQGVERASYKHYASVLRQLRENLGRGSFDGMDGILRLLLVLAFLAQFEILAGSSLSNLNVHLQAFQQTFSRLRVIGASGNAFSEEANNILSWVYEGCSYLAFCNLIKPTRESIWSIHFLPEVTMTQGPQVSQSLSPVYGGSRLLFEMIPRANALLCRRLDEQSAGDVEPTSAFQQHYAELSTDIEAWSMPILAPTAVEQQSSEHTHSHLSEWEQSKMSAEFVRHALRIYIMAARLGHDLPTPEVETAIQVNVQAMVKISHVIAATPCASNLMWAVIVGGSCVREEDFRDQLRYWMRTSHYQMRNLSLVLNVLELLWADTNPRAFGPYGVHYITEKHNLSFCIM